MINKVILLGRLGKDPDMRYTDNGAAVTRISVATERRWKDDQGKDHKETEWHQVVAWNSLAEACNNYLVKGRLVYIEGRLQTREFVVDDEKRKQTVIVAEEVKFIDREKLPARQSAQVDEEPAL